MNQLSTFYSDGHSPIDQEELRDEWISFRQHLGSYRQKTPKDMCQVLSANPTLACQYPKACHTHKDNRADFAPIFPLPITDRHRPIILSS